MLLSMLAGLLSCDLPQYMPQKGKGEERRNGHFAPLRGRRPIPLDFPRVLPFFPREKSFRAQVGAGGGLQKKLGFGLTFLEIFPIIESIKDSVFEEKAKKSGGWGCVSGKKGGK